MISPSVPWRSEVDPGRAVGVVMGGTRTINVDYAGLLPALLAVAFAGRYPAAGQLDPDGVNSHLVGRFCQG